MIKSIMVCTDGSPYSDTACNYAIYLAGKLDARLLGLHVLDSRMLEGPLMADISGWIGAQPYGKQLDQFRRLMEQKGNSIVAAFDAKCEQAGVNAESVLKMGHPAHIILEQEGRAELLVMGQKGEHAEYIGSMPGSNLDRVLRHSHNPCLVTPAAFKPPTRLLAAYDGSGHGGQALREASEMAAALNLELVITTVADDMKPETAERIARDGLALAGDHDCRAVWRAPEGQTEESILETADKERCDLIVAGAYGHSRIRRLMLGSTTHNLVARADIPVMLVR